MTAWQCPQSLLRAENSTRWTPAKSVPRVGLGVKESEILYHWVNVSCTIVWPLPQCVSYLNPLPRNTPLVFFTSINCHIYPCIYILPLEEKPKHQNTQNLYHFPFLHPWRWFKVGGGGAYTDQTTSKCLVTLIINFTQHIWFCKMIFCSSLTE